MIKHLDIKITGKVQGVFFRQSIKEKAEKLDLMGFVQNKPDGSVYIEIEGEGAVLNNFLKWCRQGSDFSKVEKIEIQESSIKNFENFQIFL